VTYTKEKYSIHTRIASHQLTFLSFYFRDRALSPSLSYIYSFILRYKIIIRSLSLSLSLSLCVCVCVCMCLSLSGTREHSPSFALVHQYRFLSIAFTQGGPMHIQNFVMHTHRSNIYTLLRTHAHTPE
jgi:hypothetical protein